MIWTLILAAIGLSCVSKFKRSTAMFGVFGWYVVLMLIGAGFRSSLTNICPERSTG